MRPVPLISLAKSSTWLAALGIVRGARWSIPCTGPSAYVMAWLFGDPDPRIFGRSPYRVGLRPPGLVIRYSRQLGIASNVGSGVDAPIGIMPLLQRDIRT